MGNRGEGATFTDFVGFTNCFRSHPRGASCDVSDIIVRWKMNLPGEGQAGCE